jgi:hypothetical protein
MNKSWHPGVELYVLIDKIKRGLLRAGLRCFGSPIPVKIGIALV